MPGLCHFRDAWLSEPEYKAWIKRDPRSTTKALCALCDKSIDISTMGKTAVTSHASFKKHKDKVTRCSSSTGSMLSYVASTSSSLPSSSSTTPRSTLSQQVPGRAQLVAETWWALKTVSSNFSFSSNEDVGFVFGNMFPD